MTESTTALATVPPQSLSKFEVEKVEGGLYAGSYTIRAGSDRIEFGLTYDEALGIVARILCGQPIEQVVRTKASEPTN